MLRHQLFVLGLKCQRQQTRLNEYDQVDKYWEVWKQSFHVVAANEAMARVWLDDKMSYQTLIDIEITVDAYPIDGIIYNMQY